MSERTIPKPDSDAAHIAALEAEVERLKCCGNCGDFLGVFGGECLTGEPHSTNGSHPCHFTPSRWKART